MQNLIDLLDDWRKRYRSASYGLVPTFIGNGLATICIVAAGIWVDVYLLSRIQPERRPGWLPLGVASALAVLLCAYNALAVALYYKECQRENPRRGFFLKKHSIAIRHARKMRAKYGNDDPGILWGRLRIPTRDREKMFLVVGNIGSGKTLTFQLLMQDQLRHLTPGSNRRALIYDNKQDCVQLLAGLAQEGLNCPMCILNPLDERHYAWDIAKDIDNNLVVSTFAEHLFPVNSRASTPFFDDGPRIITTCVLQALIDAAAGRWTFRHLILILQSEELIKLIVSKNPISRRQVAKYLDSENSRERASILSSIDAKISPFMNIAACWDSAGADRKVSIKDWFDKSSKIGNAIFVMGNYEPCKREINLVNTIFVDTIRKYGLAQPESSDAVTWLFLDEFVQAGQFEGFDSLILQGRSKGIVAVLGLQDISTLYDVYGKHRTDGFLPQIGNRAYLHLKSHENADWARQSLGKYASDFEQVEEGQFQDAVTAQQFRTLPEADLISNGLHGIYVNGKIGIWQSHYTVQELGAILPPRDTACPAFVLIDPERTRLRDWCDEDSRLFEIPFVSGTDSSSRPLPMAGDSASDPLGDVNRLQL